MLKTIVAFIKKRMKKSTISAINLWAKDGILSSWCSSRRSSRPHPSLLGWPAQPPEHEEPGVPGLGLEQGRCCQEPLPGRAPGPAHRK